MTFPDRRLEGPLEPPEARAENTQDVLPLTERNQDPQRSLQGLVNEGSRPLTDEERKMADRDSGAAVGERVYAPASERVPKTVASYSDVVNHPDSHTPEREAAGPSSGSGAGSTWPEANEPSFTRVPRPSTTDTTGSTDGWDTDSESNNRWMSNLSGGSMLPIGMGWVGFSVVAGIGIWLYLRWQRERNKPINRIRRQARQAASRARDQAYALRDQMPDMPEEAARPALGLGTALLSIALILVRNRLQASDSKVDEARGSARKASKQASRLGRQAAESAAEFDWQERLAALREFWNPGRVELEKVSIPKGKR